MPNAGCTYLIFRQEVDEQGRQTEFAAIWDIRRWAQPLDAKIAVQIDGRTVWIGAWLYVLESHMGGRQPVLLLDTDMNENGSGDREITHYLYGLGQQRHESRVQRSA